MTCINGALSLGELAGLEKNSFVDGPFGSDLKASEYQETGVPIIRLQNVRPNHFLDKDIKYISQSKAHELQRHNYKPGDLVIAKLGDPCGTACVIPDSAGEGIIVADVVRFRGNPTKVDHGYLSYFLNSPAAQDQIRKMSKGTTRQRINLTEIKKIAVPFFSLPEQRRIAAILDKADAIRRKQQRVMERMEDFPRSVFLDMFGDPVANPKGWPVGGFETVAIRFSDGPFGSNLKTSHYVDAGVRVVRLQNIGVGKFLDEDKAFISEQHFSSLKKHKCIPGDVLIGTLGDPNLRACILPQHICVALNKADCIQLRPNLDIATPEYICSFLNTPAALALASSFIHGQTRSRISMGQLRDLPIAIPPLSLQKRFSEIFNRSCSLREKHEQAQNIDNYLFESLSQLAFRGELTSSAADYILQQASAS